MPYSVPKGERTGLRAVAGGEESGPWTLWSRACLKQCAGGRGCCDHGHCGLVPAEAVCGKAWGWMMVLRLDRRNVSRISKCSLRHVTKDQAHL